MDGEILKNIRAELVQSVDEKTRTNGQRYFKEKIVLYGVKTADVNKIAKKYFKQIKLIGKERVFGLCEELFKSDYCEEAFIAAGWSYLIHKEYQESDFLIFESWIQKYINNWAKCDSLCNHTVGSFIEQYPQYLNNLKAWTRFENRWVKRASAVSLIIPAKRGKFLKEIFEISDALLTDKDDMVQKGYGWLLKDASIKYKEEVFAYILKNKSRMPRTALRYAIERMPEDLKKQAMAKE
jgi:3-methyladenine DNA glycosylase AlkD